MISRIASEWKKNNAYNNKTKFKVLMKTIIENLNKKGINLIKKGMYDAVNSSIGTAYASRTYNSGKIDVRKNSYFSS